MKLNIKRVEAALLAGMAISVFCAGFCGFAEDYRDVTETVFRLHILANSDSEYDQSLKLKVRDAVLEETAYLFEDVSSAEEAAEAARAHLDEIGDSARRVLAENGSDYKVNCEVADTEFDRRTYGNISMPAGKYSSLRITIGDAEGKNWWCVMYPPLCLPAAESADRVLEDSGVFSQEEIEMLENPGQYECKFYFLELLKKLRDETDNGN